MTTQILAEPKELIFIQSRAETNHDLVDEYAAMMRDGVQFDAAQGVRDQSEQVYVFDGLHRGEAARLAGLPLLVEVQPGTRQDAEWLALTANQKHGLRRSRADKQRIVRQALLHPYGVNLSNSEISRHCGVSDKTVARIRREMELSSEIPKMDRRIVTRNGVTYEQDTTGIGTKPTRQEAEHPDTNVPQTQYPASPAYPHISELPEPHLPDNTRDLPPTTSYEPTVQAFECPRCDREKIVGVNGSRRWCLHCGTEWPTAGAFLAEAKARQDQEPGEGVTRVALQTRFLEILSQAGEAQLEQVATWLDELEHSLANQEEQPALLFESSVSVSHPQAA